LIAVRQVPEPQKLTYLFVGNGKVSKHLQYFFTSLKIPFGLWTRSSGEDFLKYAQHAGKILLLINDDDIEPFIALRRTGLEDKTWIHFSGLLSTPLAESAHPLMTFGHELYEPEFYARVPFVTEQGREPFSGLFPELPNPGYQIAPELKPLYHAFCVMGGNFTTILWKCFFEELRRLGIPEQAAYPYLEKIAENLVSGSRPLTGPFERNDVKTVLKHREVLESHPMKNIYNSFFELYKSTLNKK